MQSDFANLEGQLPPRVLAVIKAAEMACSLPPHAPMERALVVLGLSLNALKNHTDKKDAVMRELKVAKKAYVAAMKRAMDLEGDTPGPEMSAILNEAYWDYRKAREGANGE